MWQARRMAIECFVVEAGHIQMFAAALGDTNPAYHRDSEHVVAPPTFITAAEHFDPDFPLRPRPGVRWMGSGREAIGAAPGEGADGMSLYAEHRFVYHRHLCPGDVVTPHPVPGAQWEKSGSRGGTLRFKEFVTQWRGHDGVPVLDSVVVSVAMEQRPDADGPSEPSSAPGTSGHAAASVHPRYLPEPPDRPLEVGDRVEQVVVDDLSRTQIVMYAGASGDFNPVHTDEVYARAIGLPGVFGHGMLTMGLTGKALTTLVGVDTLTAFAARFRRQVWPGDTLTARIEVIAVRTGDDGRLVDLGLVTTTDRGEVVLTGTATASS